MGECVYKHACMRSYAGVFVNWYTEHFSSTCLQLSHMKNSYECTSATSKSPWPDHIQGSFRCLQHIKN